MLGRRVGIFSWPNKGEPSENTVCNGTFKVQSVRSKRGRVYQKVFLA